MGKQGYHHGNLRQALVDATLRLIAEKGPQGFTMAEAAKLAEVSTAAPYRHFSGREALIAEAARQGFEIFVTRIEAAFDAGRPDPLAAFMAIARSYLAFARSNAGHYVAMFESGLTPGTNPELADAAGRAQAVLTRAAAALSAHLPVERRPSAVLFAAHVWAMSHGVVELYARGAPAARAPMPPEDLLESGIRVYLRGLGLIPPDSAP
ncbi:MAG: TetR/AcrR family transcriptional regulator [Roseovarius sp.]|uniref:TetR/AcrR family transcriptional regulator n=1 Tax=Roseovarius sp. TaxID=1486281 RepID=UPI001B3E7E6E|nr:TetR/AcrR family transcriptional regulator [Roseovarius sp.]MBQ0748729.1 TetR/AcrR family transcriptional regulator [Roseovarius sp.]MBQ0809953.1 TetR/AcrR family transcriptional regulator [Roseovarius sp.]